MRLNKLSSKDKTKFNKYLRYDSHELSVYAWENIYLWKGLFEISWLEIEKSLCIFFQDQIGVFLYLSPLGKKITAEAVFESFKILDKFNRNKEISRIENAEEKDLEFYRGLGLECVQKSSDYLCSRKQLAELSSDKFKSKRASFNYFTKHYHFEYAPFTKFDKDDCFKLYKLWAEQRRGNTKDDAYRFMLEDSFKTLGLLLDNYQDFNCLGRLVRIEGELKGFTFGFKLNDDTFCVLYEITDLSIKGLAQFIFREFCRELSDYKYINIMDDSGLENLKRVKLSYHPVKLVPAFIIKRKA